MGNEKERLDILLVEKGFYQTREKARSNIMAGTVFVNNKRIDKAGEMVYMDSDIVIKGDALPFVSRGGLKLEKALKHFNIDVSGLSALDVGASTGGFTDCLLKSGAGSVVSIDVGYGQFAWELRQDPRVRLMERTNIRHVTLEDIGTQCDLAVIDVSFISLKLVLPVVKNLIKESGKVVCLIKPQFEAGRDKVGKKGVVRDPAVHKEVIYNIVNFSSSIDFSIAGLSYSPIRGPEGNIEYLLYLINCSRKDTIDKMDDYIEEIIKQSHEEI